MRPSEVLEKNREAIREATKRFNAANPRVFGSVARGEDRPDSDLDILVDALPGTTLFDLGGLLEELKTILGVEVDVVTSGGLHSDIRARVLMEAQAV
ncbi:Nucleotidyltransferase domain protein [compost metagenome]|uniref:nucleotidyltransferase family protein n=1 Tax=Rhizobium/Agrobacterium group TaxID=227290 RepID=UPI0003F1D5A0|nr:MULTISPECIES: nucleotidyltransferase family protein [Rhizobium/Agrobacterium group]AHK02152.1 hypothetical protein X971_2284 [Agrobacterium tumefaciens LBA4213 (Ach5)]AKC07977.1 nucleotidyltransferase [Agrobacterium tumefaciens]AYM16817.1 nucleotidyltransferase [Agrobacterium tumefaciens]AYM68118.1 nucleotidyltransferase [Agrobacterium tumefaciens]NIB55706.1 nucleotidyltransferase family protein [Agrobacterium tumefaciens]